jgi:hypothetical protein
VWHAHHERTHRSILAIRATHLYQREQHQRYSTREHNMSATESFSSPRILRRIPKALLSMC